MRSTMRTTRSAVTVAVSLLTFVAAIERDALSQAAPDAEAGAAVRAVVARYAETWNTSDMAAWGALFTDDVDYVHRGGGWWRTNEENVRGHRRIHARLADEKREMNLQLTVAAVRFLHPDIALVHVRSQWPGMDPPGAGEGGAIMTMVMVRSEGVWRIRALQNTLVSRPAPGGVP